MKNIFNIIKLAHPQRTWIIVVALLIALQAALQQASPITLKFVVDELTAQISTGNGDFDRLLMLFGLILSINLVGVILHAVNMRIGDHIASRLGRYLTELYYKKIFTLPQLYFDSELSGKMINQLNRGTQSITDFVGSMTNFILPAILQSIFSIVVLSYYDPIIGLLSFLVFPMYVAISSYSTKKWGEIQVVKNRHIDATRGRIQEVISNIKLVKTYNTQGREWKHVSGEYQTINTLYDKQSTQYHILNFLREFGLEIAVVLILFLVFRNTFVGTLSLGEMVLIIQLLNQLRRPLYGMSYILEQVNRAEADSKAFFEVLSLKEHERYHAKALPPIIAHPAVELDHVSFSYPEGDEVLTDISVKFGKKQTVALVGHSGAGKTTLINLILKLYEPSAGSMLLDSKPYKDADHSWIRAHMALVFQDNELFSSTIRENVSYGMSDASDEAIWSALKKANAARFVRSFKDGIDTHIGERGVKLSGGQKQRIQIARAILHDKPILILDEATSSLDSKSEAAVQKALETLFKNRLVIIIAHRFSTIQNANYVVVLDQGTVADAGTPQELAKRPGIYSELLQYQIEGNNKLLSKYELY